MRSLLFFLFLGLGTLSYAQVGSSNAKKPVENTEVSKGVSEETKQPSEDQDDLASAYFSQIMGVARSANSGLNNLYQFVYDWVGTPYRLGGKSKRGIDCSGFVGKLYEDVFNLIIGDNSRKIFSMVDPVQKPNLKVGDLVFFKIRSRSITHVGIYIGEGKFAHASSSNGVRISNLDEAYWRRYYYRGGRLLPEYRSKLGLPEEEQQIN